MKNPSPSLIALLMVSAAPGLAAEEAIGAIDYGLCAPRSYPEAALPRSGDLGAIRRQTPLKFSSDQAEGSTDKRYVLSGNVVAERADQRLEAARISYDAASQQIEADQGIRYFESGLMVEGAAGILNLGSELGYIQNARYQIVAHHARGEAESLKIDGRNLLTLNAVSYTTCDPGNIDWQLLAQEVTVRADEGWGEARNARLEFKGVPILYTPYITFPIDDRRKSGLLLPKFGGSGESGIDISVPYYWNIAPDMDATFTPRLMSRRGLQVAGEFRYLNAQNSGQLDVELLPNDDVYGKDRRFFAYRHSGYYTSGWTTDINLADASDDDYFEDLGDSLDIASTTHLERRADAIYHGDFWQVRGRVQDFQTLSGIDTYQRMPQFLLRAEWPSRPYGLVAKLHGEFVHFEHDDFVKGTRFDLYPTLSLPLGTPGYYLTPALGLRHTRYALDNYAPGAEDHPSRTLPVFSIDSGLVFERDAAWLDMPLVQTLEPRLYYLRVPHRDQDDIPLFDTGDFDFSYQHLFRDNRFNNADRVGDANQLTLAVTSRYLERDSGRERLRASLGQTYYYEDREVGLVPNAGPDTADRSAIVAEVLTRLTQEWALAGTVHWDTELERTDKGAVHLRYMQDERRIANVAYRFRRNQLEQTDASLIWPVTPRWSVVGRWNYSIRRSDDLEKLLGVEYRSCCYAVRAAWRSYVNDISGDETGSFYLQMEFTGLGRLGKDISDLLDRGILGQEQFRY